MRDWKLVGEQIEYVIVIDLKPTYEGLKELYGERPCGGFMI